jgi:acid phosphatase family membrane protein YuiD
MGLIASLRTLGLLLFGRLSFCALVGGMLGAITGLLFTAIQAPGLYTNQDLLYISLALAFVSFLLVLLIAGGFCRYGVRSIFLGTLVNSLVTSVLTVFAAERVGFPPVTALLGLVIGILVGSILCRLCRRVRPD